MNDSKPEKKHPISRRDAIKTLSAAAGATLIANLPINWETPMVEVGVLPAHAATSGERLEVTFQASTEKPAVGSMADSVYTWGTWAGGALNSICIFPVVDNSSWSSNPLELTNSTPGVGSFAQTFWYDGDPRGLNMGAGFYGVDGTTINVIDPIE